LECPNGTQQKIERLTMHRSWVAAIRRRNTTTNQTIVSAEGGTIERRCDRAERVGEDVYPSFGGVELSDVKIKTERATGPRFSMASSGWGDTTTNRESEQSTEYSLVKGIEGR
jgi:DNA-binding protein